MSKERPEQTLAVFVLDNDGAAKAFLKVVQKIDAADKNVTIVDAAIADRTKRRGKVKIHQTEDTGAMKGGLRGGAIGLIVGTIIAGPVAPLVWGAAGGLLGGLHNRFRDIGIDDKFMKQVGSEVEKGKSALFVLYEGDWSGSIGAIEDAIKANKALLIHSTLAPEAAAELKALVEPAAEEVGGEEVLADFEVETEPEEEPAAPAPVIEEAEPDDLTKISGIGPKASEVLVAAGIASYHDLAGASEPELRRVFADSHTAVPRNINTWAMQASFAEHGDWAGLQAFIKASQPAASAKAPAKAATPAAAAPAAPAPEPDDLTNLHGIGPKAAKALGAAGITTYETLAAAGEPTLRKALHDKDMTAPANIATWPMQADYAVRGDWRGLAKYNQKATAGNAPAAKAKAAPVVAAPAAKPDDLTQLHGIGARISTLLADGGVTTYSELQHMSSEELREIISGGGALPPSSLDSWPTQASYAAKGDWKGLADYNKRHQA
jgi:predicted flap endonuclease-1-like 5' DNA nuclease